MPPPCISSVPKGAAHKEGWQLQQQQRQQGRLKALRQRRRHPCPPHLLHIGGSDRLLRTGCQEWLLLRCGCQESRTQAEHPTPAWPRCCFLGRSSLSIDVMSHNVHPGPRLGPDAAAQAMVACSALRSRLHGNPNQLAAKISSCERQCTPDLTICACLAC